MPLRSCGQWSSKLKLLLQTMNTCLPFQFGDREQLLGVRYDAETGEESLFGAQGQLLLKTKFDNGVLPESWDAGDCHVEYDR